MKPELRWTNILVPVDFSAPSNQAVKIAAGLAKKLDARLTLLHVLHVPSCYPMDALVDMEDLLGSGRDSVEQLARDLPPGLIREKRVQFGKLDIPGEIIEAAFDLPADLIVLGTRAHGGLARVLHGDTAQIVTHQAPCPVLTVPPGKDFSELAATGLAEVPNPFKKAAA